MKNYIITFHAFLVAVLFFTSSTAFAQRLETSEAYKHAQQAPSSGVQVEYCPPAHALRKVEGNLWATTGGWKSTNPSFLKSIELFLGARWTGVNFGEIICSYAHGAKEEFSVNLHRPIIVASPNGGKWSVEKNGHRSCRSSDVEDCPFPVEKAKDLKNVYEELEFFEENLEDPR